MFGLSYFKSIVVLLAVSLLSVACSQSTDSEVSIEALNGSWQVEDIDGGGIIDSSHITVNFVGDGQIAGATGCNRYRGKLERNGSEVSISQIAVTRKACVPAISMQEQRFVDALESAHRLQIEDDTWLLVLDAQGRQRLKMIRRSQDSEQRQNQMQPQDRAASQSHSFQCDADTFFSVRFVGPETVKLLLNGDSFTLQRDASASGALYAGEDIRFWNKGSVATLQQGSAPAKDCLLVSDR